MIYRFGKEKVRQLLLSQIRNLWFESPSDAPLLDKYLPEILQRVAYNFSQNDNKYYSRCENPDDPTTMQPYFDPLHMVQWFIFLYYSANTIFRNDKSPEARELCDKIYGISKMVSGCDLYYEIEMPRSFICDHPTGTVLGRAVYGENFRFIQCCNVGMNHGIYPVLGDNVQMYAHSKVLGSSRVGNNVIISAGTYIKDQEVPDNVIVFGTSPNLIFKERHDL